MASAVARDDPSVLCETVMSELPAVEPMPPHATGPIPWLGAGLGLLRDPTAHLAALRARLGDTFVLDGLGYRLFFVFSPAGVKALYAAPEHEASFGLATFELVLKRKIPFELAAGRRTLPHDLFKNPDVETYLEHLERAVALEIEALGARGTFEAFAEAKRLGYRLGLASWAGEEAASPRFLPALIAAFERLDSSDSFVRPLSTAWSMVTKKRGEWRAMGEIETIISAILQSRRASGHRPGDYLDQIEASFSDLAIPERDVQVARDLMIIQMGAQSNLFAALAWTLVNLLLHPEVLARVRAGDDALLERAAHESIRLAQRSLTLRQVLSPFEVATETGTYRLAPGVFLATLLSVNNSSAAPGLDRFDPDHYVGRKLADTVALPARELVSTFGHGRHSCPAQRFSISAIRIAIRRLLDRYDLEPRFRSAQPLARQIGGVARAAAPCVVAYSARA
jgi:cytochrome P450